MPDNGPWLIESTSNRGEFYEIHRKNSGRLACECTGYKYRNHCKHIKMAMDLYSLEENVGPSSLFLAACSYQLMGYKVIPIFPGEKRPMVAWKSWQDRTPTIGNLADWWTTTPDSNVGIVLGKNSTEFFPFAIDLDGGSEAEILLNHMIGELPETAPRSKTPSGYHVFLSSPTPIVDRIGLLRSDTPREDQSQTPGGKLRYPQVDIRGAGIIVLPPSIHPSGDVYEWIVPLVKDPPQAPQALLDIL